ncbi:MFS transporter [Nocardia miyunensis]|uniref:MFS transporter n=1 Tax=Nocardia miyunensis TaxID=282684 RepID=UPI000A040CC2|nr:MFS transporter [Nocardia miyunensis]
MYVVPPQRAEAWPNSDRAGRMLIGPGFAAIIGLAMLTAVYRTDGKSLIQLEFHMSSQAVLLNCVVAYVVAAILAVGLGLPLGARFPTGVILAAIGLMLVGTVLTAFAAGSAMLLVGRVLDGLGTGAAAGVIAALVLRLNGRRGIAAAVIAALGVLAAVTAPVVGQLISDAVSFRLAYLAPVPFLLVALIVSAVGGIASAKPPVHPIPYGTPYPSQGPAQYPNPNPYATPYPAQGPAQYPNPNPHGTPYPPPQHPYSAPYGAPHPPQAPPH